DAAVERAFSAFLPVLSTQASGTQHAIAERPPSNSGTALITVTQPLINASAFPLYAQARRLADGQRAQNVDDKRLLGFSAAAAFFAVLNAEDVVSAARRQLDNAKANLDSTQARAQAQLSSANDVTKAQVDLAAAQREVVTDQGFVDNALVQLAFTVNAPVPAGIAEPAATLDAAERPTGPAEALLRFAVDHRPDVLAARYQAAAAHDFAAEPMLRYVPSLNVQGQAAATTASSPVTNRHDDETITATLTWTLYDAGLRYADKHARDAQAEIADLDVQLLLRTVDAQVKSAAALLAAAQAAFRAASDAAKYARQNVEETSILYRQGLATALDLVTTNDSRFAAEVNYATARYAMAQAYVGLRQALGLDVLGAELR
ncbi:MAG TPA: TolC family protein, partial [Polyangiaceae bacterium]|nr:TolC family protein [Polyangiaceae bacterium]